MAEVYHKIFVYCLFFCLANIFTTVSSFECRGDSDCTICESTGTCRCEGTHLICSGANLQEFPFNVDDASVAISGFTHLDFSTNNLTSVPPGIFVNTTLVENVDLSNNKISTLSKSFDSVATLKEINLANNTLVSLADNSFIKLFQLKTLDLSGNELNSFNPVAFSPNLTLESLLLRDNQLNTLPNLHSIFPQLKHLDLTGNELVCNVDLSWIAEWGKEDGHSVFGTCNEPQQLLGLSLQSILAEQFADPSFVPTSTVPPTLLTTKPIKMQTTEAQTTKAQKLTPAESVGGANVAAIVVPLLIIVILVVAGAILGYKYYWLPRHQPEKKYSAVNKDTVNSGNRVYGDVTTEL